MGAGYLGTARDTLRYNRRDTLPSSLGLCLGSKDTGQMRLDVGIGQFRQIHLRRSVGLRRQVFEGDSLPRFRLGFLGHSRNHVQNGVHRRPRSTPIQILVLTSENEFLKVRDFPRIPHGNLLTDCLGGSDSESSNEVSHGDSFGKEQGDSTNHDG